MLLINTVHFFVLPWCCGKKRCAGAVGDVFFVHALSSASNIFLWVAAVHMADSYLLCRVPPGLLTDLLA